jgi:hypothetical protein
MDKIAFTSSDLDTLVKASAPSLSLTGGLGSIVTILIPYLLGAAGFALLIYIIIGGYQIMLSGGDPKSIAAGRSKITNAVVGILIVFLAFGITLLIAQTLGLDTVTQIF